jgi:hypothetical protein
MSRSTNLPHTFAVEFQSENSLHRGVVLVPYCKTPDQAIEKLKREMANVYKYSNSYYYVVR